MKNTPKENKILDQETEIVSITNFIKDTWAFPEEINDTEIYDFVKDAFIKGAKITENNYSEKLNPILKERLIEKNLSLVDRKYPFLAFYDGFQFMVRNCIAHISYIEEKQEYKDYSNALQSVIKNLNTSFNKIRPILADSDQDYKMLRESFQDNDCFNYWEKDANGSSTCSKRHENFKGHTFEGIRTFSLVDSTAIHYILQSDVNQARRPLKELISAIICHASYFQEHNNVAELVHYIDSIVIPTEQMTELFIFPENPFFKKIMKELKDDFEPLTPENKAIMIKKIEDFDSLTDEEKEIEKKEEQIRNVKKIREILKSIK